MGYYAKDLEMELKVKKENKAKLQKAIEEKYGYKDMDEFFSDYNFYTSEENDGTFVVNGFDGKWFEETMEVFNKITEGSATFRGEDGTIWTHKFVLGEDGRELDTTLTTEEDIDYKALFEKQKELIKALKADYTLTYQMYDVNETFSNGMRNDEVVAEDTDYETYEELDMAATKAQEERIKLEEELAEMEKEN